MNGVLIAIRPHPHFTDLHVLFDDLDCHVYIEPTSAPLTLGDEIQVSGRYVLWSSVTGPARDLPIKRLPGAESGQY